MILKTIFILFVLFSLTTTTIILAKHVPNRSNSDEETYEIIDSNEQVPIQERSFDRLNKLKIKTHKRGFNIQTFYSPVYRKDGKILLIPKDSNKNHYFIG